MEISSVSQSDYLFGDVAFVDMSSVVPTQHQDKIFRVASQILKTPLRGGVWAPGFSVNKSFDRGAVAPRSNANFKGFFDGSAAVAAASVPWRPPPRPPRRGFFCPGAPCLHILIDNGKSNTARCPQV